MVYTRFKVSLYYPMHFLIITYSHSSRNNFPMMILLQLTGMVINMWLTT